MRIIGGEWRGRKIEEPRGRDVTRPTTDRVREACASMVMSAFDFDLDEVRVLDAFGGAQEAWEARETEEFRQAARQTAEALDGYDLPELRYFREQFLGSFQLTLDEME